MNRKIITLSLAAQLIAFGASAQTSETSDTTTPSASYGSDWSTSLGSALFAEGGATVRPSAELTTQWATLSDEDKAMIQRDCMAYMQESGGTSDTTDAATDTTGATGTTEGATTDSTTTTGTADTTTGTDTDTAMGTDTATGTDTTTDTATDTTSADATTPMNVTMEQMEEICAATKDM